jgi:hypothetical protein
MRSSCSVREPNTDPCTVARNRSGAVMDGCEPGSSVRAIATGPGGAGGASRRRQASIYAQGARRGGIAAPLYICTLNLRPKNQ